MYNDKNSSHFRIYNTIAKQIENGSMTCSHFQYDNILIEVENVLKWWSLNGFLLSNWLYMLIHLRKKKKCEMLKLLDVWFKRFELIQF